MLPKLDNKGLQTGLIWSVGVGLIVLSFVGLVVGTTQQRAETIADDGTAADTYAENLVDEAGDVTTENFPLLGLVVTITIVAAIILILRQVL